MSVWQLFKFVNVIGGEERPLVMGHGVVAKIIAAQSTPAASGAVAAVSRSILRAVGSAPRAGGSVRSRDGGGSVMPSGYNSWYREESWTASKT